MLLMENQRKKSIKKASLQTMNVKELPDLSNSKIAFKPSSVSSNKNIPADYQTTGG